MPDRTRLHCILSVMLACLLMPRLQSNALLLTAGLLVLALAAWASTFLLAPPAAVTGSSGSGFSAGNAWEVLERLAGDEIPHPIGSAENVAVRGRVVAEFLALDYEVEEQSAFACREAWASCGFVTNVIARVPGTAGQPSVLMTAHYDSVGAGPGVADDLAGVAALVEVARLERDTAKLNPLLFVITDGEEVGLLGAEGFTRHEAFADVAAVVNVEARGTSGQSLLFETNENNAWIISAFAQEAPSAVMNSLYYELYRNLPNDTDFSVYREAGLQGLNFAAIGGSRHYHTTLDNLENMSADTLQHQGENLLAAARALSGTDLSDQPAGDSLFLTLLPGVHFQFPAGWSFYLALASLVMWFVASGRLVTTGQVSGLGLFLGVAFALAALLLAAVLGQAISWLLPEITGHQSPWWANPMPAFLAMGAAAITAVFLAGTLAANRTGFWGLALGLWFWFALIAFLLLEWLPGASVVFLVPATVMAFTFGLPALSPWRDSPQLAGPLALLNVLVAASIWWPLAYNVEQALGLELGAGVAMFVAFGALSIMPLLAVPRPQRLLPTVLPLLGITATVVAIVMAARVPMFTEDAPQFADILHYELAEEGESQQALWLLDLLPNWPVPGDLDAAAQLSTDFGAVLPWSGWGFHQAPAEPQITEFPEVQVTDSGSSFLRLALQSARGGQQIHLFVPETAGLQRIDVVGMEHSIAYGDWAPGAFRQFSCHGPECHGLELDLHFAAAGTIDLLLADQTQELPPGGSELQAARGDLAVPWQDGDVTLAINRQTLEVP